MESVGQMEIPYGYIIKVLCIAFLVAAIVYFMFVTPRYRRQDETDTTEPFFGGVARGSGHPDCLRTLPEGSEILDMLSSGVKANSSLTEGQSDYSELELILSKMACLKKDLLSPSGMVDSTRYQAFETAHDRMNVAEVCGMCLNQTIASRDLDIVFATWRDRGRVLLRKLCTEAQLNELHSTKTEALFKAAWDDVYNIATSKCLKTDFSKQNGGSTRGGDVGAYEPDSLKVNRTYDNLYGGLSASGWNGAV